MKHLAAVLAVAISLSACGGERPEAEADSARCSEAKKAKRDADQLGKGMENQTANPATAIGRLHHAVENGRIDDEGSDAMSILYSRQLALQIVSDSPTCFSPSRVADARNQLKFIDPLMIRATDLQAKQAEESGFRELDRLWEKDTIGD